MEGADGGLERAGGGAARTRGRTVGGGGRGGDGAAGEDAAQPSHTAAMAAMASVRPCRKTEGWRSVGGGSGGRGGGRWGRGGSVRGHGVHAAGKLPLTVSVSGTLNLKLNLTYHDQEAYVLPCEWNVRTDGRSLLPPSATPIYLYTPTPTPLPLTPTLILTPTLATPSQVPAAEGCGQRGAGGHLARKPRRHEPASRRQELE